MPEQAVFQAPRAPRDAARPRRALQTDRALVLPGRAHVPEVPRRRVAQVEHVLHRRDEAPVFGARLEGRIGEVAARRVSTRAREATVAPRREAPVEDSHTHAKDEEQPPEARRVVAPVHYYYLRHWAVDA